MSKTIEQILEPKPELRPRIYAYSIADKAHEGNRANGASYASLGQRPRYLPRKTIQALKGRSNRYRHWAALSGLGCFYTSTPRALPWAVVDRPDGANMDHLVGANMDHLVGANMDHFVGANMDHLVGANMDRLVGANMDRLVGAGQFRANGASYASLGQRPRFPIQQRIQALKGRSNRCPNPSPESTFTSFSAQKTENRLFPIPFVARFMPILPQCFKTSVVLPCSSIQSKTIFICSSIYPARWQLAKRSKMSKSPLPSGSKRKEQIWEISRGNQVTELSLFPSRTSRPSGITLPGSESITASRRFRKSIDSSSNGIPSPMTRDMYGIDLQVVHDWIALSGLKWGNSIKPRALPWAGMDRPVGAGMSYRAGTGQFRAKGANYESPGQRPGMTRHHHRPALKGRHNRRTIGTIDYRIRLEGTSR